jgi:hypothetical protein
MDSLAPILAVLLALLGFGLAAWSMMQREHRIEVPRFWRDLVIEPCPHDRVQMHAAGEGEYRYTWLVCKDCHANITGGPLKVDPKMPEKGWRK